MLVQFGPKKIFPQKVENSVKSKKMGEAGQQERGWLVTIFDKSDKKVCDKTCQTLAQVAELFGKTKACDLSHLIYRVGDESQRKRQMLQRFGVWFTLARQHAAISEQLRLAILNAETASQ